MDGKRILIVDDEPAIVDLLREILASQGLYVDAAHDATKALELVRENIYDAAFLDFNLPDMNGIMLHRQIRQMDEELADHTLFTSGMTQSESDLDYYDSFGQGFLPKPFQLEQVLKALEGVLNPPEDDF
jgi:DNA-binding response OmpR family regulator